MTTILEQIVNHKRQELVERRKRIPLEVLRGLAEGQEPARDFPGALSQPGVRIIAECKRQSPSKGILQPDYDPVQIALAYERGGAAAISVLTDENFFGGSLDDLSQVRQAVCQPVLRKDFIIDEYQIWEARAKGADTFLLLASILDHAQLQYFLEVGRELGMEPLLEVHNVEELERALKTDARVIGVNNRNLNDFSVDLGHSVKLFKEICAHGDRLAVCESGIYSRADVEQMQEAGYNAFLVGEALVTATDHEQAVRSLMSSARQQV